MPNCDTYDGSSRGGAFTSIVDMISREFLSDTNIPVAFGFLAGHGTYNFPLLMGEQVQLNVRDTFYTLQYVSQ